MIINIDGLERSGNVYLSNIIGICTDATIKSFRTHNLETLKNYTDTYPFIVPVRDALPCITSSKVFRDHIHNNQMFSDYRSHEEQIEVILLRYKAYTAYLVESPKFFIAPFHVFTVNHDEIINKMQKFYNFRKSLEVIEIKKGYTKEQIISNMNQTNINNYLYHPELGNLPREDTVQKKQIEEMLLLNYSKDIKEIQDNIDILYSRYNSI